MDVRPPSTMEKLYYVRKRLLELSGMGQPRVEMNADLAKLWGLLDDAIVETETMLAEIKKRLD